MPASPRGAYGFGNVAQVVIQHGYPVCERFICFDSRKVKVGYKPTPDALVNLFIHSAGIKVINVHFGYGIRKREQLLR